MSKIIREENTNKSSDESPQISSKEVEVSKEEPLPKESKSSEKSSPTEDDDWEKELLNAEFDMVKETSDENWEEDLNELLESCKTEK